MIRNLKVLGLALVAVFAMSAVAASMASADTFKSETGLSVTLTGKQSGTGDVFTTTAGTVKCKQVNYTGTSASGVTTVTATPNYPAKFLNTEVVPPKEEQNCTGFGFPAEIATNGCTYLFHLNATTADGTLDVVCPEGKEITVTAAAAGTTKCIVHVAAQKGLGTVTYKNIGATTTREVEIAANISKLSYKHTAGTGLGACTSGAAATGTYVGNATVTGETDGVEPVHVGIFLI